MPSTPARLDLLKRLANPESGALEKILFHEGLVVLLISRPVFRKKNPTVMHVSKLQTYYSCSHRKLSVAQMTLHKHQTFCPTSATANITFKEVTPNVAFQKKNCLRKSLVLFILLFQTMNIFFIHKSVVFIRNFFWLLWRWCYLKKVTKNFAMSYSSQAALPLPPSLHQT